MFRPFGSRVTGLASAAGIRWRGRHGGRRAGRWTLRFYARNHRVEEALAAASSGDDLAPFERLLAAVRRPFDDEAPEFARYAEPAPAEVTACYQTFCGT